MFMNITNVLNSRKVLHFRAVLGHSQEIWWKLTETQPFWDFCFAAQIYCGIYILPFQSDIKYKIQKKKKTANYLQKTKQRQNKMVQRNLIALNI